MTTTDPQPVRRSMPPVPICSECGHRITDPDNVRRLRDGKGHFTGGNRCVVCPIPTPHVVGYADLIRPNEPWPEPPWTRRTETSQPSATVFDKPKPKSKIDWLAIGILVALALIIAAVWVAEQPVTPS